MSGAESEMVLAEWPKSNGEMVRVRLSKFKTVTVLDIRAYFLGRDGTPCPSKKGIAIPVSRLADLSEAIARAQGTCDAQGPDRSFERGSSK